MAFERLQILQQLIIEADADELLLDGCGAHLVGAGGSCAVTSPFDGAEGLREFAVSLARHAQSRLDPMCGAAGGSVDHGAWRWHCLLPPLSRDGVLFSLRRHRFAALSLADFGLDEATEQQLRTALAQREHLVIVGPTGSGKTSLLMALLKECALHERVVIIESLPELPRLSPTWVRLAARAANVEGLGAFGLPQLLVEALRLRPDRLVIGEVRGPEAGTLIDALATGHTGVMATLHAGSAAAALQRLKRWDTQGYDPATADPVVVVEMLRGAPPVVRAVRLLSEE